MILTLSPGWSEVRTVCGRGCGFPWCVCGPGLRGKACGPGQNTLSIPPSFSAGCPACPRGPYRPLRSSACVVSAGPSAVATRPSGPLVSPPHHPSLHPSWAVDAFTDLPCLSGAYRRGWQTCPAGLWVRNDVYSFQWLKKIQTKNNIYDIQISHIYITYIRISYIYKYMKFQCHICAIQMPNNKVLLDYNHTHWFTCHLRLHFCDKDSVE